MSLRERLGYLAAVLLLGAALGGAYRLRPPGPRDDPAFAALQADEQALAVFDSAMVAKLRRDRDLLARSVTPPPLAELKRAAGNGWVWAQMNAGEFAVTWRGERAKEWPEILAALGALEKEPGVFLESADFSGDGRQLLAVKLSVRVRAGRNETKTTTNPS